jgi:hypothetical protein
MKPAMRQPRRRRRPTVPRWSKCWRNLLARIIRVLASCWSTQLTAGPGVKGARRYAIHSRGFAGRRARCLGPVPGPSAMGQTLAGASDNHVTAPTAVHCFRRPSGKPRSVCDDVCVPSSTRPSYSHALVDGHVHPIRCAETQGPCRHDTDPAKVSAKSLAPSNRQGVLSPTYR